MTHYSLSFAGAGRVAGALCRKFYHAGHQILQVVSETEKHGPSLALSCNGFWSGDLTFNTASDIIIVSVPDHRLNEVLLKIVCNTEVVIVHTAGSYGLEIFPQHFKKTGVLYPLQTFSYGRELSFEGLPFLLEASDANTLTILKNLAISAGGGVHMMTTDKRRVLHLSAVFVSNFTNFMLTAGQEIATSAGLAFDLMIPLINETISRALESGPEVSQTGPAIRNDVNTIEKHLELLSFSPYLKNLYGDVTDAIREYYKAD